MTLTLIVMAAALGVAAMAAWWQNQQHRATPTATPGAPPGALDRSDFRAPDAPLLIAVFTAASCSSCEAVWAELAGYESSTVATQEVEVGAHPDLHRRYSIESVPTAVIVDEHGETQAAFVGPLGPDHRQVLRQLTTS